MKLKEAIGENDLKLTEIDKGIIPDREGAKPSPVQPSKERKTMSKLYIFMDTEHDAGGRSVKFISEDRDKVITFIGNYAIDSKNEGSTCYYEIVEVGLDVEL